LKRGGTEEAEEGELEEPRTLTADQHGWSQIKIEELKPLKHRGTEEAEEGELEEPKTLTADQRG
jgi:hypothetical protein